MRRPPPAAPSVNAPVGLTRMPAAGVRGDEGMAELARAAADATASIGVDEAGLDLGSGVPAPRMVESRLKSSAVNALPRAEFGCCGCGARADTSGFLAAALPALEPAAPGNTSNCGEAIGRATRARAALGVPAAVGGEKQEITKLSQVLERIGETELHQG